MGRITTKKENVFAVSVVSLLFPLLYLVLVQFVPVVFAFFYSTKISPEFGTDQQALLNAVISAQVRYAPFLKILAVALFIAIVSVIFSVRRQSLFKRIQCNPVRMPVFGLVVLLGISQVFVSNLLAFAMPQNWMDEYNTNIVDRGSAQGLILAIIVSALLVPLAEEIAFRGLMMTRLEQRGPVWLAISLPVLVFSIAHTGGSLAQAFGVIQMAIILGLVFYWTRSIQATIIIHTLNNFINVITPHVPVLSKINSLHINSASLVAALLGLVVTVAMLYLIFKRHTCPAKNIS